MHRMIESITFQLQNQGFELGIDDLNKIFEMHRMHILEPLEYDPDEFWNAITLQDEPNHRFNPALHGQKVLK
ncbi:hypothetical protein AAHA92_24881 [Salvia divinorum]|uniref:Uncharacterized protein n=1 Tax=Salvia divinorum TaxID=28513 RepID=A0ABD1G8T6_SALDI